LRQACERFLLTNGRSAARPALLEYFSEQEARMPATDDFDIDEAAAMDFGEPAGPELLEQFEAVAWSQECADAGVS
jgi:hypothetical protein